MKKKAIWSVLILAAILGGWAFISRSKAKKSQIAYTYSKVKLDTVTKSTSGTGVVVPLTQIDVKCKAGGPVLAMYVDLGAKVKKGDPIAKIDPTDTLAAYKQAQSDLSAAQATYDQAKDSYQLQVQDDASAIANAKAALRSANVSLSRAQLTYGRQPALTTASIAQAKAAYDQAVANQTKLVNVTVPQTVSDAKTTVAKTKAALDAANADLTRQQSLLAQGYVSQAVVDTAKSTAATTSSDYASAQQRVTTLEQEMQADIQAGELGVQQALQAMDQATANKTLVNDSYENLIAARVAVQTSNIALQKATVDQNNDYVKKEMMIATQAAVVRNQITVTNSKVQLDSCNVVAPFDGVVTLKYIDVGTILPPGESLNSPGTSIVQLSDDTTLYVDCAVDESDIGAVRTGQRVDTTADAYPGEVFSGKVFRVNPTAITAANITSVTARVQITGPNKTKLKPGMNATCKFIVSSKPGVLVVPNQAVDSSGQNPTVKVETSNPAKPEKRQVVLGVVGDDNTEIVSGLKEGDQVVTGEIDMAQLELMQQQLTQNQQQGGLTATGNRGPSSRASSKGGASK